MAQRQFRSDDTSLWTEKFGNGSDGAGSINTSTFAEANETFTGTEGESTGTAGGTGIANNDLVLIHQTQHATNAGKWELNKVTSGGGSTSLTFKYALCNTYSSGAQILKLKQYSALTVNTSQIWTGSTWNGSKGGIVAFLVNGVAQGPGTILVSGGAGTTANGSAAAGGTGRGFKGGASDVGLQDNTINGGVGASCKGENYAGGATGGGGGAVNGSYPDGRYGGGAGGGHGAAGSNGSGGGVGATNGTGGEAVGNEALTLLELGSGGGGSADHAGTVPQTVSASGGSGAGAVIIIAKEIKDTLTITATGGAGGVNGSISGGSGAGGSILLKGQTIALGSGKVTAAGGTGGASGAVGRIHIDYLTTLTGTTTPTLDSTQDASLTTGGGNFLPFL